MSQTRGPYVGRMYVEESFVDLGRTCEVKVCRPIWL